VSDGGYAAGCFITTGVSAVCGSDVNTRRFSSLTMTSSPTGDVKDVAAGGGRFYAAGEGESLYRGTTSTGPWSPENAGQLDRFGVTAVGATVAVAVGESGNVARCSRSRPGTVATCTDTCCDLWKQCRVVQESPDPYGAVVTQMDTQSGLFRWRGGTWV
jgi:hypothetical protein